MVSNIVPHHLKLAWARLTDPPQSVKASEKQQQGFLLSAISLVMLLATFVVVLIWLAANPHFAFAREIGLGFFTSLLLVFGVSRTRYYYQGIFLFLAALFLLVISLILIPSIIVTSRIIGVYFLLIAVILSNILLTVRDTVLTAFASLLLVCSFFFIPQVSFILAFATFVYVALMSALIILDKTIRNRSAAQLREAEAQYRGLFEQTHDAVFIIDLNGNYLQANAQACDLLGYTLEELRKLTLRDTSLELAGTDDVKSRLLAGEVILPYERHFRTKSGASVVGEINVDLVRNSDGTPRHIQAVLRDLTQRNQFQDEQNRQNEFLALLHRVTLDLLNRRDRDDFLQSIINRVSEIIDAPYIEILFREEDELVVHACTSNVASVLGDRAKRDEATLAWKAHDTQTVVTVDNYSTYPHRRDIYDGMNMAAVACIPIVVGKECVGVVDISRDETDHPFTAEEVQKCVMFVQLLAVLIDNANLHESSAREIAQRKQTETELRTIQERQQALIAAIPDIIFRFDKNGTYVDLHAPQPELLVVPPDQLIGKRINEVMPPEYASLHMSMINQVLATGEDADYDYELPINGNTYYFESRMVASGHDEVIYITRNVTDQKKMQKRDSDFLQDMKALQGMFLELAQINDLDTLYRCMVEFIQQRLEIDRVALFLIDSARNQLYGTYGVDAHGNIRNEGYYHEAITPNHWTLEVLNAPRHATFSEDALVHDNAQPIGRAWRTATALWDGQTAIGYLVADNFVHHRPPRPYQAELSSLLGSTYGHLIRLKQTQITLHLSEERQRALLSALPDMMFRFGRDGVILDYHPSRPDTMQLNVQSFLGRRILDALPPDIAAVQMENIKHVLETGEELIAEYTLPIRGQNMTLETRMVVSGRDEVLTIVRDIGERKKLEEQSFRLAVETARAKVLSQFVENASHELRTPLSIINTAVFLLANSKDESKLQEYASRATDQIKQLSHLINMILSMTKLDSTIILKRVMVDLHAILYRLVDAAQDRVNRKHVTVTFNADESLPLVNADSAWLREALGNIFDNAVRFTPDGGSITITTYVRANEVVVEFVDTGIGISDDALPHIFERFWRQDEAHTTPGFGLGLPIAARIIELHTGDIEVISKLGQGSTFRVILPILPGG